MSLRSSKVGNYFLKDINPVIRFLILSDVVLVGSAGLLGPIFALFVEDFIVGGNAAVAGVAAGVYLFSRSILQIPIAHLMDKIRGEKDDFWLLLIFSVLMSATPIFYLVINTPLQLYLVQFVFGIFSAVTYPAYMAIFTRHIDKDKEGTEWSIYFTLTDITSASLAIVGGYIASTSGFPVLIMSVVILSVLGCFLLLPIRPYLQKRMGDN